MVSSLPIAFFFREGLIGGIQQGQWEQASKGLWSRLSLSALKMIFAFFTSLLEIGVLDHPHAECVSGELFVGGVCVRALNADLEVALREPAHQIQRREVVLIGAPILAVCGESAVRLGVVQPDVVAALQEGRVDGIVAAEQPADPGRRSLDRSIHFSLLLDFFHPNTNILRENL